VQAPAVTAASASARRPRTRTGSSVNQAQPQLTPADSPRLPTRGRRIDHAAKRPAQRWTAKCSISRSESRGPRQTSPVSIRSALRQAVRGHDQRRDLEGAACSMITATVASPSAASQDACGEHNETGASTGAASSPTVLRPWACGGGWFVVAASDNALVVGTARTRSCRYRRALPCSSALGFTTLIGVPAAYATI
jgi:hypothetical protein